MFFFTGGSGNSATTSEYSPATSAPQIQPNQETPESFNILTVNKADCVM